jgi:two-component system sensor histidine kinase/response regulator
MTANAMVGDKERCLDAGMNDFIAKPVDVAQLFLTLARWVRPSAPAPAAPPGEGPEAPLPSIPGLKMEAALQRMGGNVKLMRKLLNRFVETQIDVMARITAAIENNDLATATREAHTAKGLAGNIGAGGMADSAARLEHVLAHGAAQGLDQAMDDMRVELNELVAKIALALHDKPAAAAPPQAAEGAPDMAALTRRLGALARLLAQDDAEAVQLLDDLCADLAATGQGEHARQLKRQLGQYDFEGAMAQLNEVAAALGVELQAL